MLSSETENCIVKFLLDEASSEELDFLSHWIIKPENEKVFDAYVKAYYEITSIMSKPDADRIKDALQKQIESDTSFFNYPNLKKVLGYAAIVALCIGLWCLYQKSTESSRPNTFEKNVLIPDETMVVLDLGNGKTETLHSDDSKALKNSDGEIVGKQRKKNLTYTKSEKVIELVYNTLHVPHGKQFEVKLSDGTIIHLNSGTTLKYPVEFLKSETRKVYLTGEAFFAVEKDKSPFVINTNGIDIEVLGTKFNVASYQDENRIQTVLVEGSVKIKDVLSSSDHSTVLTPGHMASWNKEEEMMKVAQVNTGHYTAWMNGQLILRKTPFKIIRKKLERFYNVTIVNHNIVLDEKVYNVNFKDETIAEVLQTLNENFKIEYEIVNNQIVIN